MKNVILIILLFFPLAIFSQSSNQYNSIGLGTGVDIISFKDKSSSPLAYSGVGLPIALRAKFGSGKTLHQINLSAISEIISNNYPLSSKANTTLLTWEKASLNYSFLHQIKNDKNYLGGSLNSLIFYRKYDFLDGQSYEFINSLDVNYMISLPISDKYELETHLSLPILAFIHRKPTLTLDEAFLDDFHNNGNLLKYGKWKTVFADWFGFNLSVRNKVVITDKIFLTIEVGMNYYYVNFPERVSNINYPILCHINYRF